MENKYYAIVPYGIATIRWESDKPCNQEQELAEDLKYYSGLLKAIESKLGNEGFLINAKQEIVGREWQKKLDTEKKINDINVILSKIERDKKRK